MFVQVSAKCQLLLNPAIVSVQKHTQTLVSGLGCSAGISLAAVSFRRASPVSSGILCRTKELVWLWAAGAEGQVDVGMSL